MPPADRARDRWELWLRVLDHALVPPPDELAAHIAERLAGGESIWSELVQPRAGAFVFDAAQTAETKRVASAAFGIGIALHDLHCPRSDARIAGEIAMWLTLAAAAMDHLVDDGVMTANAMRRFASPGRVIDALRGGPPVEIPGAPWATSTLELALATLRRAMTAGDTPFHRELCTEIEACIRTMLVAQLRSDELRIGPHADLARVRADLQAINALTVWIGTYAGLFGHEPADLEHVRRAATLFGELGWALDALSDIHTDLDHGVFSLVWLELAEHTGLDAEWLVDRSLALAALAASPVVDRILARCALQCAEIARQPGGHELASIAGYMVAAFLHAEPPA